MRSLVVLFAMVGGFSASAAPCFHAGTYSGMGMGVDSRTGKKSSYEVETVIANSTDGKSSYVWGNGGNAAFTFSANNGKLLIDGADVGGKVDCGLSTINLHIPIEDFSLNEEWTFFGNYLLRSGTKVNSKESIAYQELLIRK
jgi:hypothetical protein